MSGRCWEGCWGEVSGRCVREVSGRCVGCVGEVCQGGVSGRCVGVCRGWNDVEIGEEAEEGPKELGRNVQDGFWVA